MHLSEIFDSKLIEVGQKKLTKDFNKIIDSIKALNLSNHGQQQILDVLRSEFVNKNTEMVLAAKTKKNTEEIKDAEVENTADTIATTDAPE